MFTSDDDDEPAGHQAAANEMWERASSPELDEALAVTGVYVQEKAIVLQDAPGGPLPTVLFAGVIGRLAFVDPSDGDTDEAFDELVEQTITDDFHAVRRDLLDGPESG